MIPGDLAARLRLLTEAKFFADEPPLEPLQPARAVPSQLPEYRAGDKFSALIQKALPDGTFEAVVDGRTIKLALPQQAQVGERLALVVARNTPHAVLANLAAPATTETAARAALSPTGRLISFLLTGQPAPEPPSIARGQPLQTAAGPLNPAALAAALRQGISESGMFYESHLARWSAGDLSTEVLRREPQARQPAAQNANQTAQNAPAPQGAAAAESGAAARSAAATAQTAMAARIDAIPERLLPVMHQQLDALATHNYSWLGQAWPGQVMELEIEDPQGDGSDADAEDTPWKTTLRLNLPTLGGVEARIALDASGIRIKLSADDPNTTHTLEQHRGALADAMGQANITLKELLVGPHS